MVENMLPPLTGRKVGRELCEHKYLFRILRAPPRQEAF